MPLCSAFAKTQLLPTAPTPPAANKNWNPGNYIASTTTNNDSIWNVTGVNPGILQRLAADTNGHWKGALLRFQWTDLEGSTLGSYAAGMDKVQSYLDQMAAYPGRRLIIFIHMKTFGATNHAVPAYMRNSATYGDGESYTGSGNGEYAYESGNSSSGGGFVPNMHVNAVRDRLKALMQEFANRFNNNPYLEAVAFSEASILQPIGAPGSWSNTAVWFTNMANAFTDMRTNLSNIQICQWVNADRSDMKTFVPDIRAAGIGLGMPDLCQEDLGFNWRNDIPDYETTPPGNIQHCQDSNGLAIIMGHASRPSLDGQVAGRCQVSQAIQGQAHVYPDYPGVAISRQAVRDFAVNTVGVTHLCWAHNAGTQPTTGSRDPNIPTSCQDTADNWTAYTGYGGVKYNTVTDNWINDGASNIATVTTRPSGW